MSLTYLAEITLKPESFADACKAVAAIVPVTRAEAGCEAFEPHQATDGSPVLFIYERWADQRAFEEHHAQAYTRDVFTKYEDWLAQPVRLTELGEKLA